MKDKKRKSIGTVTLGTATDAQKVLEIEDVVRAELKDHRLVSIARTEEDSYLLCIENPASSGRSTQQSMYLTEGSVIALFSTYLIYLTHHGINTNELFEKYMQGDDMVRYEFNQRDENKE